MIFLDEVLKKLSKIYIQGTVNYLWPCYGKKCKILELTDTISLVFNYDTNRVYEITILDELASKFYDMGYFLLWVDPEYIQDYVNECRKRNVYEIHIDDFRTFDEIIEKISEELND